MDNRTLDKLIDQYIFNHAPDTPCDGELIDEDGRWFCTQCAHAGSWSDFDRFSGHLRVAPFYCESAEALQALWDEMTREGTGVTGVVISYRKGRRTYAGAAFYPDASDAIELAQGAVKPQTKARAIAEAALAWHDACETEGKRRG